VHFTEGSYERIAAKLFRNLDVDAFYVRLMCSTFHLVHVTSKTDISIVTARVRYTTRWGFLTIEISSPRQNCRPWSCDNQESQGKPNNKLRVIIERPAMTIIARKHETAQVTDR